MNTFGRGCFAGRVFYAVGVDSAEQTEAGNEAVKIQNADCGFHAVTPSKPGMMSMTTQNQFSKIKKQLRKSVEKGKMWANYRQLLGLSIELV